MKECGADANAADENGGTVVMWAAMGGHTATAVALVSAVRLGPERAGIGIRVEGGEVTEGMTWW